MASAIVSQIAALQRAMGVPLGVKPGPTPEWQFPVNMQRQYQKRLLSLVQDIQALYTKLVLSQTERIFQQRDRISLRSDDMLDDLNQLNNLFNIQGDVIRDQRFLQLTSGIPLGISGFNVEQWARIIRSKFGIPLFTSEPWLAAMVKSWNIQNSLLITGMLEDQRKNVQSIVLRNFSAGLRHEAMILEIQKAFGVSENRAKLIARDQTNKLNGDLMKQRQQEVGLTHYIWRDSADQRVRPSHRRFNGNRYSWSPFGGEEAPEGNPGQPIRCRCFGDPIFDDIDKELKELL